MRILLAATILMAAWAGIANAESLRDDDALVQPFHTDASMTTVKSEKEFKEQLAKTPAEDTAAVEKICATKNSVHADFCNSFNLYYKK